MIDKKRPTTAVIAVAGYGARMLPITKTIEKCMLPICNKPIIDYIVEDCINAGINRIIMVTSQDNSQIKAYFSGNTILNDYLKSSGKASELDLLNNISKGVEIEYVVQDLNRYGTAVPLATASPYLKDDETFVLLMGDDFIVRPSGESALGSLIDEWQNTDDSYGLIGVEIPKNDVSSYGVLKLNDRKQLVGIVDRPAAEEAPSNIINVSKYVFNQSVIKYLNKYLSNKSNQEFKITDVINIAIEDGNSVLVATTDGQYLDGGNLASWLFANNYIYNKNFSN